MKTLLLGFVVVAVVLWGIIQYLIKFAAHFDLFFVNSLGMGFGSGVVVFAILLVGGTVYGIVYSHRKTKPLLNIILLSFSFIVFGYSSFTMILIRAKANPTLNNSDPDNAFSFLSYLNREQYGDKPLLSGPYFDSRPIGIEEGNNTYRKGAERYEKAGRTFDYAFDRETVFPRTYSWREPDHQQYYRDFLNLGEGVRPTFADNLRFFFGYQIGHMYGRYFLWNFAGRQNDQQGHGDPTAGNWVSGIKFIDQLHVGGQDALPESQITNPSYNRFYFLPLILGLIGAFWHFKRRQKDAGVVGLLFFMTGIAIVLYLNQSPLEPRERDYAYAASFYAFAIWIGLGVLAISEWLNKKVSMRTAGILATVIGLFAGAVMLAKEGWDDHNRSEKYLARDMAINYLESCAPNAILFTYGDNDTYPLWYAQEVENVRPDIRVVNLSLLSADWYVRQVRKQVNDSPPLPIGIPNEKIVKGVRDFIHYQDAHIPGHVELDKIVNLMLSDNPNDKWPVRGEEPENFLPTKNLQLTINKADVIKNDVVPEAWQDSIVDTMTWTYNRDYVSRAELAMMDILVNNNWERPIYFASTVPRSNFMGLDKYLVSEGFALRLMPIDKEPNSPQGLVNADAICGHIKNKYVWGNINTSSYVDPESYNMLPLILGTVFSDTASQLIAQGRKEQAKEILEVAVNEVIPSRTYSERGVYFGYLPFIQNLYAAGVPNEADELATRITAYLTGQLTYYASLMQSKPNLELQKLQLAFHSLNSLGQIVLNGGNESLAGEIQEQYQTFESKFY